MGAGLSYYIAGHPFACAMRSRVACAAAGVSHSAGPVLIHSPVAVEGGGGGGRKTPI